MHSAFRTLQHKEQDTVLRAQIHQAQRQHKDMRGTVEKLKGGLLYKVMRILFAGTHNHHGCSYWSPLHLSLGSKLPGSEIIRDGKKQLTVNGKHWSSNPWQYSIIVYTSMIPVPAQFQQNFKCKGIQPITAANSYTTVQYYVNNHTCLL